MDDAVRIAVLAGLPFRGLRDHAPDPALLASFPPGWLAARGLLPLSYDDGTLVLELSVADDDYGQVIGRGGRTAQALRTVVKAAAVKDNRRVLIDIVE